jgi:hypothetical protein
VEGGPGGQTMMITFALKNLNSEDWRDRAEHTGADGGPINLEALLLRAEEKREQRLIKTIEHEPTLSDKLEQTRTIRNSPIGSRA